MCVNRGTYQFDGAAGSRTPFSAGSAIAAIATCATVSAVSAVTAILRLAGRRGISTRLTGYPIAACGGSPTDGTCSAALPGGSSCLDRSVNRKLAKGKELNGAASATTVATAPTIAAITTGTSKAASTTVAAAASAAK